MDRVKDFLSRIGLGATTPTETEEFLNTLQERFVLSVPYENLDIINGKPISLDPCDIYEKIVARGRGGYCFELNALLHHMLSEMNFTVKSVFARFLRGESEIPFRRHRVVIVTLAGCDWMMDVGVGQIAPRRPLKLVRGEVQEQGDEKYRFEYDEALGWVLYDLHNGQWRRYISFTTEMQYENDFVPTSFWCEHHGDSPFNKKAMLSIKTADGRKTLDGNTFKIFRADSCIHEEEIAPQDISNMLSKHFGLNL